jgi:hypothetical protein
LPASTQDGIALTHIFEGSTESEVFEDLIE